MLYLSPDFKFLCEVHLKNLVLGIPEITADHPEVQAMVEGAMKSVSFSEDTMLSQMYAEALEEAIAEVRLQVVCSKVLFPKRNFYALSIYILSFPI